ncbi:MAG: hypothetical protein ABI134_27960 [Byssovorax sp.]
MRRKRTGSRRAARLYRRGSTSSIDGVGVEPDVTLNGDAGPAWLSIARDAARARLS